MQLSDLMKHGIPQQVINLWQEHQGAALLPVQQKAVRSGLLERVGSDALNMLVCAPTSSGKSFCAEMAMIKVLTARQKTVLLFPLKSLAEQKYNQFKKVYKSLGIKVIIVTSDHPENDQRFMSGNFQVALVIYEKFDLLLTTSLDALKNIGLVVVDEIQTIAESGRGALLERLLTKIQSSIYQPSILGLSAVISENNNLSNGIATQGGLATWMGAVVVEETTRPVDLLRGVAAEGSFKYRSYNSQLDSSEPFAEVDHGADPFDVFASQIKKDSGSTLVFLKARRETVESAFRLAAMVNWPGADAAIEQLQDEEPSFLVRSLRQVMGRGVAFHSSDLSPRQRMIVEQAFVDKKVRVLFSTTTLAMGVNLPADTVYLETVKYAGGKYGERPSLVPVSRSEFDNMTGRAGRLGLSGASRPGRAVVLAENQFDRDILWENYIADSDRIDLRSSFESLPLADWAMNFIVSGLADSKESLIDAFARTFYVAGGGVVESDCLGKLLESLINQRMVSVEPHSGQITATALGRTMAQAGLSVKAVSGYLKKIETGRPDSLAGWVALALSSPDWNLPPSLLSRFELANNGPISSLYQCYDHLIDDAGWLLGDLGCRREPLSYRMAAGLKSLLLICDWANLTPAQKIEERFQVHLGQVINLAETTAHLIGSLGRLLEVAEGGRQVRGKLSSYVCSLRFGLPEKFHTCRSHFGPLLNRADYVSLEKHGIDSLEQVARLADEDWSRIIKSKDKLLLINKKMESIKQEVDMSLGNVSINTNLDQGQVVSFFEPEKIEIDGRYERERYLVKINGFPVRLTGKSFKYFVKLAYARLFDEAGWIYKEDIEAGFNQARYLYRMKNEINAGLTVGWSVVENNRLGYYRINCAPAKISIDFAALQDHPDWELQELAKGKSAQPTH